MKEKYSLKYQMASVDNPMANLSFDERVKIIRDAGATAAIESLSNER